MGIDTAKIIIDNDAVFVFTLRELTQLFLIIIATVLWKRWRIHHPYVFDIP